MKDFKEVQTRLRLELTNWFPKQVNNLYEDFYLYYSESTPMSDSGLHIARHAPANDLYKLIGKIKKGWTVEANFTHFSDILFKLPVLDIPWDMNDNELKKFENLTA